MRTTIWPAALAVFALSAAARAEDQERRWSLGAGVTFAEVVSISPAQLPGAGALVSSPTAVANLERRLDRGLWLTLGVAGGAATVDTTISGVQSSSTTRYVTFAVAPGLRKVVTPDDAPVEVSVLGEVQLGFARGSFEVNNTAAASTTHELRAGLLGGFAVERRLIDGLSVRAAARLLNASYDRATSDGAGTVGQKSEGFSVGLIVSPSLEMRFAF